MKQLISGWMESHCRNSEKNSNWPPSASLEENFFDYKPKYRVNGQTREASVLDLVRLTLQYGTVVGRRLSSCEGIT